MVRRILKIELFLIAFIAVCSLVDFYFKGNLPDNFYSISSDSTSNFAFYYLFSSVAHIGHFTGIWSVVASVGFGLLYFFIFSKRDFYWDGLAVLVISLTSLFAMSLVSSSVFLGESIDYVFDTYINLITRISLTVLFFLVTLALVFRSSFKDSVQRLFMNIWYSLRYLWSRKSSIESPVAVIRSIGFTDSARRMVVDSKLAVNQLLRRGEVNEIGMDKQRELPNSMDFDEDYEEEFIEQEIVGPDGILPPESVDEDDRPEAETAPVAVKPTRKLRVAKKRKAAYKPKELISCIAPAKQANIRHPDDGYFEEIVQRLEQKITEFKIEGKIINILKGPVVDTYELELGAGVKVSKVTSISEDLGLALYGAPIRIVYPMKGRKTVGIEVPRDPREVIYLDEVLKAREFSSSKMRLPIAMGKDAFGDVFVRDLAGMPHMLVAGATGAGKSVFVNTLLVSLLVKLPPEDLKLILIDPKQLELNLYGVLPHLIMPVVTDAKLASHSLLWACQEMDQRYSVMKELEVRNIEGFNEKIPEANEATIAKIKKHYPDCDPNNFKLPYIVIVVDEFADLILTKAGKEIETNICRLAGKARAAGIHLVLATQRPSVDVITGLIKSNFPVRVSFRVTTDVDSRTILNAVGAEKLLGKGDMLFKHGVEMFRLHSSYVDENEVGALCQKLAGIPQEFDDEILEFLENGEVEKDPYSYGSHIASVDKDSSGDELFHQAVEIVMEMRSASASMLQRRLSVGYNRAANLIEAMEEKGIVGPSRGSKPREVLIASE